MVRGKCLCDQVRSRYQEEVETDSFEFHGCVVNCVISNKLQLCGRQMMQETSLLQRIFQLGVTNGEYRSVSQKREPVWHDRW